MEVAVHTEAETQEVAVHTETQEETTHVLDVQTQEAST